MYVVKKCWPAEAECIAKFAVLGVFVVDKDERRSANVRSP